MIDLNNIGRYRENNRIEAKKSQGGLPQSLWETYSAFANTLGGIILLGVVETKDKTFQTVPLKDPEGLANEFWALITSPGFVSVNILREDNVQIVESQGNRIVAIEVPRASRKEKPVYIGKDPFSGSYRRSGEGDYHCTQDEVISMLQDREDGTQDMQVVNRLSVSALESGSVRRYRERFAKCHPEDRLKRVDDIAFLKKIGAVYYGEDEDLHPTIGGLLMFGAAADIQSVFPYYLLEYREEADNKTQTICRLRSDSGDWSGNLFDFYSFVSSKLAGDEPDNAAVRQQHNRSVCYALCEALANALMHANYYSKQGLIVTKTKDKIVITNPGGMRVHAEDAMKGGFSDPRNMALIKMFHFINVGSGAGSGLSQINTVWQTYGWQAPKLEEQFNPDRTTLSLVLKSDEKDEEIKQKIIDCLTEKICLEIPAICSHVGISKKHAKALLRQLVQEETVVAEADGGRKVYRLKA